MGVAGCGKTTIGKLLSKKLCIPFFDADDFHSTENIKKMASGTPLTDADREPWLETLAVKIREWNDTGGAILACSALKEKYRKTLMGSSSGNINWVYLESSMELIAERLRGRKNHFFNPLILESQFNDLEPPNYGVTVNINQTPDLIVEEILSYLNITTDD